MKTKLDRKTKRVLKEGMPEMDEPEIGPVKKPKRPHSPKLDVSAVISKRGSAFDSLSREDQKKHLDLERMLQLSVASGPATPFDLGDTKRRLRLRYAQSHPA